jgi:hypothetical protein
VHVGVCDSRREHDHAYLRVHDDVHGHARILHVNVQEEVHDDRDNADDTQAVLRPWMRQRDVLDGGHLSRHDRHLSHKSLRHLGLDLYHGLRSLSCDDEEEENVSHHALVQGMNSIEGAVGVHCHLRCRPREMVMARVEQLAC